MVLFLLHQHQIISSMGGSRKNFRGGEPSIVGIKVAQFNVLLELQLITSLVISQIPVESANTRVGKSHIWGGSGPPLNPPMISRYLIQHVSAKKVDNIKCATGKIEDS